MMETPVPFTRDLVLLGGGHTHALVLRKWGMSPVPGARLTLVHPGPTAAYSGMLPGHIAGHYTREELEIDITRLARFAGARLIVGYATGFDPASKTVRLQGGGTLAYDILSIDVGVTSQMPQVPGFTDHALPAKPLDRLADGWEAFVARAPDTPRITVIGGGVAGAELAMATGHRLKHRGAQVTLVERDTALTALPPRVARALRETLQGSGVSVIEGTGLAEVRPDAVILDDGRELPSDCTIGAAGARPHPWIAEAGLPCEKGYLTVDDQLRSIADACVYATGDCAHLSHAPRPKAGVFAVRAAPILAHNLAADLTGRQRRRFQPQRDYLKLISLGAQRALGEKSGLTFRGPWVWRWKDRIDRTFMDKLSDLPQMPRPKAPARAAKGVAEELSGPMPCGGCGAKLGADVLTEALHDLPGPNRTDVELGMGDDAAVLRMGTTRQVISTDHLRGFALDPVLVAEVAALHAMGDAWAMGARPQSALAQITLPQMQHALQSRTLREIMTALATLFTAQDVQIVGGHSTQGAELQAGFTITGLLDGDPITTAGAQSGDALILTRPLGTGVVLAAEMAARAPGGLVTATWAQMRTPQAQAARILTPLANAMTDVTGFGLLGHLWEICRNSGLRADILIEEIPIIDGVTALVDQGIGSSLLPTNRSALSGVVTGANTPRTDLLYDPQTAGGFLAAIPQTKLAQTLQSLRSAGINAAHIGTLHKGPPGIEVT